MFCFKNNFDHYLTMLSELTEVIPGIGLSSQLKGPDDGKKGQLQEDPLLAEKATLPTGVFAVHVFGYQNLYLDQAFATEHFGMYVQITAGSTTKCTSLQLAIKKGKVVWNEVRNFPVIVSSKLTSPVNKVVIAVLGYDKLQPIPKHKLIGKTEFHLHKLVKKQWSMETFELQNRKKQYSGEIQLELAFAYGSYGYGLCDQIESHHPPRYYLQQSAFPHLELHISSQGNSSGVMFAPKRVPHPSMIPFKKKITNLEPELSPYYLGTNFVPNDAKRRPLLQQRMTRLNQLHSDYCQLTTRTKRINFLKRLLQEKDLQNTMAGDQESDSNSSSPEDLGDVTQLGLAGALAQMANMTFLAGAPELIQSARKSSHGMSSLALEDDVGMSKGGQDLLGATLVIPGTSGLSQQLKPGPSSSVSIARASGGQTTVGNDGTDASDDIVEDENEFMAAAATRGRRTAVVVPKKPRDQVSGV